MLTLLSSLEQAGQPHPCPSPFINHRKAHILGFVEKAADKAVKPLRKSPAKTNIS